MRNLYLVIRKEFLTRVGKRSFWLLSLLGPVILSLMLIIPLGINNLNSEKLRVLVNSAHKDAQNVFETDNSVVYEIINLQPNEASFVYKNQDYDALVDFNKKESWQQASNEFTFQIAKSLSTEASCSLEKNITSFIAFKILQQSNQNSIHIKPIFEGTKKSNPYQEAIQTAALFSAILIYFFIFMYSVQVMRSVIEEKAGRVIELIVISVNPFVFMAGKIIGLGLVAFTQFLIWIFMSSLGSLLISQRFQIARFRNENLMKTLSESSQIKQTLEMNHLIESIYAIPFFDLLMGFVFFFIFGYLLYAAIFAAVGSLVSHENDTQSLIFPVTFPLLGAFVMVPSILKDSNGFWAQILSIIPFTSPVIMPLRIGLGVAWGDLLISCLSLVATFLLMTWLASKTFRTGILMYGKKVSFGEIIKNVRHF